MDLPAASDQQPSTPDPFNRLKACRYGQMLYNIHDLYVGRSFDL